MVRWMVSHVPLPVLILLFVIVVPALTVGVQALVRRWAPKLRSGTHNDVAGFLLAIIGVLYAVVVAFVVVSLWDDYSSAKAQVGDEASALRDLVRDADAFGEPAAGQTKAAVVTYLEAAVNDDWAAMEQERESPGSEAALQDLYRQLQTVQPRSTAQEAFLNSAISHLDDATNARDKRLQLAAEDVPAVLWLALLMASMITIGFCLIFGMEDARLHYVMIVAVAMLIGVMLLQVVVLDFPYSGDVAVGPEPLAELLADLR
jgi:hypothetical protein